MTSAADRDRLLSDASRFYWYHCVELAPGVVTDGDYDMAAVWRSYRFPGALQGLAVLDVGRGSGFFAFAFEDRGARVVATDIGSLDDWDWIGGVEGRVEALGPDRRWRGFTEEQLRGAFHFAKAARGSTVEAQTINVYDVEPACFGSRTFDLVFAGSIVSHLRDPILAFERLRSVTRGLCVVAAPSFELPGGADYPLMALVGKADPARRSWWVMNPCGLVETLRCGGFSTVEIVSEFRLHNRHTHAAVDHLVAHARP